MSEELETQRQLAYIAALRDARLHRSAYFEKLALLNGGTVALVITAILGPMKGQVPHKHLLATALTIEDTGPGLDSIGAQDAVNFQFKIYGRAD